MKRKNKYIYKKNYQLVIYTNQLRTNLNSVNGKLYLSNNFVNSKAVLQHPNLVKN